MAVVDTEEEEGILRINRRKDGGNTLSNENCMERMTIRERIGNGKEIKEGNVQIYFMKHDFLATFM